VPSVSPFYTEGLDHLLFKASSSNQLPMALWWPKKS
jgi:hypothetical protein